jgi:hypothetical protein
MRPEETPRVSVSIPSTSPFTPCATCGALLLIREWISGGDEGGPHWRTLPQPVTPITGGAHACD